MPRPDAVLAGLEALLDKLSTLNEVFFRADVQREVEAVAFGSDGKVTLRKLSFTAGDYSNIAYEIRIDHPALALKKDALTVYVRNPSSGNPGANRKAFANAVEYLLSSEDTIRTRDVDAGKFETA